MLNNEWVGNGPISSGVHAMSEPRWMNFLRLFFRK